MSALFRGFAPLWEVITQMCDQLSNFHSQFVKMLTEVSREIMEYNVSQKDKMKMNVSLYIHYCVYCICLEILLIDDAQGVKQ